MTPDTSTTRPTTGQGQGEAEGLRSVDSERHAIEGAGVAGPVPNTVVSYRIVSYCNKQASKSIQVVVRSEARGHLEHLECER